MQYERAYKEEPDKWLPIGQKDLREVLRQHYTDVETAVVQINIGYPIQTAFATYRKRENQDH
jgi:hypothetical protein